jgi:hypothetical protein
MSRLSDRAIRVLQAAGVSAEDFKLRQDAFDDLKANGGAGLWIKKEEYPDLTDSTASINRWITDSYEQAMLERYRAELRMQKTLPITIEVDGERKVVGEAVIETTSGNGYTIMRAILEGGPELMSQLQAQGLSHISIGTRADFEQET